MVGKDGERVLIAKGAPESTLPLCVQYETDGASHALDADARAKCIATYQELSGDGYRVLAVATRAVPQQLGYFVFLVGATATYLLLVQWAKGRLLSRLML